MCKAGSERSLAEIAVYAGKISKLELGRIVKKIELAVAIAKRKIARIEEDQIHIVDSQRKLIEDM